MSRRPDAIDIVKLFVEGNYNEWNAFLRNCLAKRDIAKLVETRRRLQRGMDIAAKQKLNTEKVCLLFIRLQRSLEKTMKAIVRERDPNPCDNPLIAMDHLDAKGAKKKRDEELEKMLHRTGY